MLTTILVSAAFAALSVGLSFWLSSSFWRTDYSRTNTSGDFGTPRGGFLSILGGAILSMALLAAVGKYVLPVSAIGITMILVMVLGAIAGMAPLFMNTFRRPKK